MEKILRRTFAKGLAAGIGSVVLGFDPIRRSWVTSALAGSSTISIPNLDGVLLTDPSSLAAFADDFGHIVHRTPVAVLQPGSIQDVLRAVGFCRDHSIQVATRGQGHSTAGQSQVQGGLVIDSSTLNAINEIGNGYVNVQAGLTWKNLLKTLVPLGLHPPVLTGLVGLSIGGTLSMGGIGPASFRNGAIVDNVLEIEVITGAGEPLTCSPQVHPELFQAVIGGVGQYGVIVRAKIPTVSVLANARSYVIPFVDPNAFFAAMNTLTSAGTIDGIYALLFPPWATQQNPTGVWLYALNVIKFFSPSNPPNDADLIFNPLQVPPQAVQITDSDTLSFDTSVDALFDALNAQGLIDVPHVWGDVFLPASQTPAFVQSALADLTPADLGPASFVLLFPVKNLSPTAPAFRLPAESTVFLFDVLTADTDAGYDVSTETAKARARFEAARAVGGTLYPIGNTPMSKSDWATQYGPVYSALLSAKAKYDPKGIMTPGPGIF
jgi:FAD/FMN-containing dehydrogenase